MKKNIFFLILLMAFYQVNAQTNKGDWMVGGNIKINTGESNTQIGITPSAASFIGKNFAVGGTIGYEYSKQGNISSATFGIGPMARFYMGKNDFRPFFHTHFNFLSVKNTGPSTSVTTNGISYLLGLGGAYFINKNIALEGIAGYNYSEFKNAPSSNGFNFSVGFQVYLKKSQLASLSK
jgi:hypothetical protein